MPIYKFAKGSNKMWKRKVKIFCLLILGLFYAGLLQQPFITLTYSGERFIKIAAGSVHSLAIKEYGSLWVCSDNYY